MADMMHGHAEVRAVPPLVWTAMPDLRFEIVDGTVVKPGEPSAAFYWRGTGRFTGPLDPPGFAPTGKPIEFFGADFQEYRDGRVAKLRIVFDNMDVARKLGLLPAAGSRADRAGPPPSGWRCGCARCAGPELLVPAGCSEDFGPRGADGPPGELVSLEAEAMDDLVRGHDVLAQAGVPHAPA